MPQFIEKPTIIGLKVKVPTSFAADFAKWQAKLNAIITDAPGFVSLEFISPPEKPNDWMIMQRFADLHSVALWKESEHFQELLKKLKEITANHEIQEIQTDESKMQGGITEVLVAEVSPEKQEAYRNWTAKIHQVEATFPGFRGVYVQSPVQVKGRYWITLLQFDSQKNLDQWLNSPERQELLKDSSTLTTSLEAHRVVSPYAGWFASIAKVGEVPPVWKQTMLVLLVLFPIVMFELKYLSPVTANLNMSLATFIGNAISVTLISFPMMPIAIWLLGWWLSPDPSKRMQWNFAGTIIVCILYLIEIILLWNFIS